MKTTKSVAKRNATASPERKGAGPSTRKASKDQLKPVKDSQKKPSKGPKQDHALKSTKKSTPKAGAKQDTKSAVPTKSIEHPTEQHQPRRSRKPKRKVFAPHPVVEYTPMKKRNVSIPWLIIYILIIALVAFLLCAPVYSFSYRSLNTPNEIVVKNDVPLYELIFREVTDLFKPEEQRIIDFALGPMS